jgi:hypothetical protein
VLGDAIIDPALLTTAERIQHEGYLRRQETNAAIVEQAAAGMSIKEIVRCTGHSRGLVGKILRGQRTDLFRERGPVHSTATSPGWTAGQRNGAALWRALRNQGF